jgi:hypothetical protein
MDALGRQRIRFRQTQITGHVIFLASGGKPRHWPQQQSFATQTLFGRITAPPHSKTHKQEAQTWGLREAAGIVKA